jgi:hypothetical protein
MVKGRNNRAIVTRVMNISFKSDFDPNQGWPEWTVINDSSIRQVDGFNCGPIACLKVMEVFGILKPGSISDIEESGSYRTVVMNYYQECINKYRNDIFLELRKLKLDRAREHQARKSRGQQLYQCRKIAGNAKAEQTASHKCGEGNQEMW